MDVRLQLAGHRASSSKAELDRQQSSATCRSRHLANACTAGERSECVHGLGRADPSTNHSCAKPIGAACLDIADNRGECRPTLRDRL